MSATKLPEQPEKLPLEEQREVLAPARDQFEDGAAAAEAELVGRRLRDHWDQPEDVVPFEVE